MLVPAQVSLRPEICRLEGSHSGEEAGQKRDMYRQEFQVLVNPHLEGWRREGEPRGSRWPFSCRLSLWEVTKLGRPSALRGLDLSGAWGLLRIQTLHSTHWKTGFRQNMQSCFRERCKVLEYSVHCHALLSGGGAANHLCGTTRWGRVTPPLVGGVASEISGLPG